MNRRLLTILLISFVIAGACAFLVYKIVGNRMMAAKPVVTTRVVAAASDIKLGAVLAAADLTTVEIQGTLPKGAILKPEELVGRGVISEMYQGEPILESRLAPPGSGGGMAATIPQGMRACAVKVDQVVGVAGFVTPGMRVDVLASGNPPGATSATQGTVTKTILQNIQVLSAGTDIQKDAEGKPQQVQVVNLLVTPEQAQTLSLASNELKIQLVLRNPLDTKIAQVASNAMGKMFGDQAARCSAAECRRAPRAASKVFTIEVINGTRPAKKNSDLPRQSSESEEPAFPSHVSARCVSSSAPGRACRLRLHRLHLHRPGPPFRTRRTSFQWQWAKPCWWIACGRQPGGHRTGRGGGSHRDQPDRDHGERQSPRRNQPDHLGRPRRPAVLQRHCAGQHRRIGQQHGSGSPRAGYGASRPDAEGDLGERGHLSARHGKRPDQFVARGPDCLHGGKVVNLLNVEVPKSDPQILLKVRFASVDRSKAKSLGINLFNLGLGNAVGGISHRAVLSALRRRSGASSSGGVSAGGNRPPLSNELNLFAFFPGLNSGATIQALETRGVVEVLAEPNIVAIDGQEASFLAGGEYPYPVVQGSSAGGTGAVTIEFKEYGVRLNFIPTITPRGTIRLQVAPEVSALDFSNAVQISGFNVPAITTRKVKTEVELSDGASFVIGGLIDNRETETFEKIPFIGDIPILGKFFQSKLKNRTNTELMVMVTPEIVAPHGGGHEAARA